MRGRSCTQPFLVEKSACRPDALLLPLRWANRSPPHPTRLRRPTFPPRGRLWGWEGPFSSAKPPLPARPAGGRAVTGVGQMGRRPGKKEGAPPQGPPNQKRWVQGGRTSSSLVFFPPAFFQRKPGSPAGVGGAPGALRPKGGFRATHLEGTSPRPPKKSTCKPLYSIV